MDFAGKLLTAWTRRDSMLCVGLDPDITRLPKSMQGRDDAIFGFCVEIVEATADAVCAFKPQIGYFSALRAEPALERLCHYIRDAHPSVLLILDAKRGDIGPTAMQYAKEAFDRYRADAVTVNPYLGSDSLEPFLANPTHGAFVLCRTSNPGSGDFQSLSVAASDGTCEALYMQVARRAATSWSANHNCGLVMGATYPNELSSVRQLVGEMPLLVPGIGAQGGSVLDTVKAGTAANGFGMVINSSRAILYASAGDDFAAAARQVALTTRDEIRRARDECYRR